MRGLNFSLRQEVFRVSRDGTSFQSVVSAAKEAELMAHLVNSLVPHLEVKVSINGVARPSVKGRFMHHYLLLRVVRHITGLQVETTMVVHQGHDRSFVMVVEILITL